MNTDNFITVLCSIGVALLGLLCLLGGIAFVVTISLIPSLIVWLTWNHVLFPAAHQSFTHVWLVLASTGIILRMAGLIFAGKRDL